MQQMEADEEKLYRKLEGIYQKEAAKLEKEIAAYYAEFGEDNIIEYRNLTRYLSDVDRRLLMEKMDDFAAKYPQYEHLMPVRESVYKLNELEAIQMQIYIQQMEIGAIERSELEDHLKEQARRGANLAAEEMGFGKEFYSYNAQIIIDTVGAAWAKAEHFSERIWANRQALADRLNDDFAKDIARGVAYDKVKRQLAETFEDVSSRNIKRLVFTEGTFAFNEAQARVHEEHFESYVVEPVKDQKVCEVCRDIHRQSEDKPFAFKDRAAGVNFPPLHPWCRCVYTVAVADWDAWIDGYVEKRGGDIVTVSEHMRELSSLESKSPAKAYDLKSKGSIESVRKRLKEAEEAILVDQKGNVQGI